MMWYEHPLWPSAVRGDALSYAQWWMLWKAVIRDTPTRSRPARRLRRYLHRQMYLTAPKFPQNPRKVVH